MTPQDRDLKKQLLVMKGEALRVKLRLEKERLLQPMRLAGSGFALWKEQGWLGAAMDALGKLLPNERLRRWLQGGTHLWVVWRLLRRAWPR
ncbi:hypothetical protein [Chromobacterium violaceum]|uniref:hypothetical protein n=1 Tax=Chromobacterium violaceum TaxID=536 RepID=UPI001C8C9CBB|nr:hypothetical protein [Chromobacterium violaceum]